MQHLEVRLPSEPGRGGDHADRGTARQHVGRDHPVDQPAVPDEVDALDTGRSVGDARAGEQRVDGTAALVDRDVDRGLVGEIEGDRLRVRQRDGGPVHDHDLGAGVLHELGDRGAHAGRATDHEGALAVVPECVEQCHCVPLEVGRPAGGVRMTRTLDHQAGCCARRAERIGRRDATGPEPGRGALVRLT